MGEKIMKKVIAIILTVILCAAGITACAAESYSDGENVMVSGVDDGARLIIAEYNEGGRLVGCKMYKPENGVITAPDTSDTVSVKTFLWNMDTLEPINVTNTDTEDDVKMNVQIGDAVFTATLEDNAAVGEFIEMMKASPVTIEMSDYSGFEKVGSLGRSLTTSNSQMTTDAGDIVLYNGNQIVMFYGSNSWSYTKLGHIDDLTGWRETLGSGGITAVFSLAE